MSKALVTQLTEIADEIKRLDIDAMQTAQSARLNIVEATKMASKAGALLCEAQQLTGRGNYKKWLAATFGEEFVDRAKRYRKASEDPRQLALGMGIMPMKEPGERKPKAKPDRNLLYINKLTGYLRTTESISSMDRVALQGIVSQLKRHGLV